VKCGLLKRHKDHYFHEGTDYTSHIVDGRGVPEGVSVHVAEREDPAEEKRRGEMRREEMRREEKR
jgi:hypothetical protein